MHPTVISDKPGSCPVCGMDLVRKARAGEEVKITGDIAKLIQSPNESVIASIKTIKGEYKSMPVKLNVQGVVTYDTRFIYTIPARFGGRLEKVYLKSGFQWVNKGQKVVDIYSPELITAERELIYLLQNDNENTSLIETAKKKLELLGLTSFQINELANKKETTTTLSVYSPYQGYVINDDAPIQSPTSSSSMTGSMNGSSTQKNSNPTPSALSRAGDYVSAGQTLFKVVKIDTLRIELSLPIAEAGSVKVNDVVDLNLKDGASEKVKVDFIQPFTEQNEEFIKVRLVVKNMNRFKVGEFVQATLQLQPIESLWIPIDAIVDTGLKKIVFIKDRNTFKPKEVKTGARSGNWIEVKGLASADELASNAHYLVDSEDFIKINN